MAKITEEILQEQNKGLGSNENNFGVINKPVKPRKAYLILGGAIVFISIAFFGLYLRISKIEAAEQVKIIAASAVDCHYTDDTFQVQLNLNTGTKNIVAAQVIATYDKSKVEVTSIDTAGSAFSYEVLKTIDATNGKILLAMARPTPGVNAAAALIGTVNVKALGNFAGSALTLKFASMNAVDDSAAILDDGQGTNVLEVVENSFQSSVACDVAPPTASITSPANNATVSGTINFNANATDNVAVTKVDFMVDGTVKNTDTTSPYNYSLDTKTLTNGTRKLEAKACDAKNNCATSTAVNVTVDNDITPPTVSITAPANNATVSGTINFDATASDNKGVTSVAFMVDGAVKSTDTTSPYSYSLDTKTLSNGTRKLEAKACDAAGNCATSTAVNVTVDNDIIPPTASITSPANNATVSGTINFNANAADNVAVTKVDFMVDGAVKNTDTTSPYSYSLDTKTLANGTRKLEAKACDAKNNCATSTAVNVTVSNDKTLPIISAISASSVASTSAVIGWTTNEAATSRVEYGLTTAYGSTTTNDTSLALNHSQTISGLMQGKTYHYRVISADAVGNNTVSSDMTFTTPNPGDLNADSLINNLDFDIIKQDFQKITASLTNPKSDIDGDGQTTIKDVGILMSGWR